MPERIQLRRTAGWRKPEGAIVVARPSRWGNPYIVHRSQSRRGGPFDMFGVSLDGRELVRWDEKRNAAAEAVERYRGAILAGWGFVPWPDTIRAELRGKDLACWCPLDQPCHADVLLEIANGAGS